MDRAQMVETIGKAVAAMVPYSDTPVDEGKRLFEDLGLDSTSIVELMIDLEDNAGVVVDTDAIEPDVFETVGSLVDFLMRDLPAER
ncbi:phosphopantetheine-binding protein [Streptomyces bingchenggensis BCW-1]|uniref:Phosphopantetheine-binding protein n=1 Tax=Streptomyces bingchenggensis (strain BCW-1) TaxID=749414 RepID=D7C6L8_STRBB|nr:phosphopantetheine-binding protein [Streptomyces bingchenggensis]ADI06235.1 phosphopantetheine-binding protein [Streptomyces bingchenggensis BCW-1]